VLAVALALGAASAHAQGLNPGPPGPFVIDIRGATSSVPSAGEFYPPPDDNDDDEGEVVDITVPARGFGFEVGAHVYPFQLGPARIGLGASYTHVRATVVSGLPVDDPPGSGQGGGGGSGTGGGSADDAAPVDVILTARSIAPQVSFNFGSANGWSYLSAGYGRAAVRTTLGAGLERSTDGLSVINFGGGARWFFSDHFGIGFDVRWHRAGSTDTTPGTTMFAAAVGLSVK
jgi:hypothetical protein